MGMHYTGKADVYSFGVICWESIARKRFFEDVMFMKCAILLLLFNSLAFRSLLCSKMLAFPAFLKKK